MMRRVRYASLLAAGILLVSVWSQGEKVSSLSPQQTTYVLRTSVFAAAGASATSGSFSLKGTLAQSTPTGTSGQSGTTLQSGLWHAWVATVTGIETELPLFANQLSQNYPNPFNPTTTIEYNVAAQGLVDLTIYNIRGQQVRRLVSETKQPGPHTATWNGSNDRGEAVASGVYLYRLRIGGFSDVKKMVFLK